MGGSVRRRGPFSMGSGGNQRTILPHAERLMSYLLIIKDKRREFTSFEKIEKTMGEI